MIYIIFENFGAFQDTCTLRITIIDENDSVPVFDDNIPTLIEIDDSRRVGEILGRLMRAYLCIYKIIFESGKTKSNKSFERK